MDIATIIGVILGFAVITTAIVAGGGWQIFIHIPSLAITIGGMLCATLIHFSLPQFLGIFAGQGESEPEDDASLGRDTAVVI